MTPTPISALQERPPSPRVSVSRKQFPTRVSERESEGGEREGGRGREEEGERERERGLAFRLSFKQNPCRIGHF